MNPYDTPPSQQPSSNRRVRFSLAITILILVGITAALMLGAWARREARLDRSNVNFRRIGEAVKAYERDFQRLKSKSIDETEPERKER